MNRKRKEGKMQNTRKNKWWLYLIGAVVVVVHFIPLYILFGVAAKSSMDTSSRWIMPAYIEWNNFKEALNGDRKSVV